MRKKILVGTLIAIAAISFLGCGKQSKEACLKKHNPNYKTCEDARAVYNLQNTDDAIKWNEISKDCGCKE